MMDPVSNATTMPGARVCAACGTANPASAKFCNDCGAALPVAAPSSAHSNGRGAASPNGRGVAAVLSDARDHLLNGRWDEAALGAEAALLLDPHVAEAHHVAAQARLKQGLRGLAIDHAEQAAALEPGNLDYQAGLLRARGDGDPAPPRFNTPVAVATAVGVLVLLIILTVAFASRGRQDVASNPPAPQPASASPFSQSSPSAYPQPARTGTPTGIRPRTPSPSHGAAPPGPTDLAPQDAAAPSAQGNAVKAAGPAIPSFPGDRPAGLAPAPVDIGALQKFPNGARNTAGGATAPAAPNRPAPAVIPQAQPGGGTAFGQNLFGTPSAPPPASTPANEENGSFNATPFGQSATPSASPSAPASPQQQYVQRNYGAAIQGYQRQIAAGAATGAKYQQLALTYERVGDARSAADAYGNAIAAYQAQIAAGQDVDVATRGLRASQRALQNLKGR